MAAQGNQMSAMGMTANMYGSQASGALGNQFLNIAGNIAAGYASGMAG
jgi:hypothetical protein